MDKISVDFIIFLTLIFCSYSSFKRGFFKEFFIAIAYIPYMGAMFYVVNEFIQGDFSFDSILFKVSSMGGFYLAYLFVIWGLSKALTFRLEAIDESLRLIGKTLAGFIGFARTVYFLVLCIIAFNIHVNQPDMIEKSKFATILNPYALKAQEILLSKGYINNEITLYEDAANGTFEENGKYVHPVMKKIKNSDRYKEVEQMIDKKKLEQQAEKHIKQYLEPYDKF